MPFKKYILFEFEKKLNDDPQQYASIKEKIKLILEESDEYQNTPLHLVCFYGLQNIFPVILELIHEERKTELLNKKNNYQQTPLYSAQKSKSQHAPKIILCMNLILPHVQQNSSSATIEAVLDKIKKELSNKGNQPQQELPDSSHNLTSQNATESTNHPNTQITSTVSSAASQFNPEKKPSILITKEKILNHATNTGKLDKQSLELAIVNNWTDVLEKLFNGEQNLLSILFAWNKVMLYNPASSDTIKSQIKLFCIKGGNYLTDNGNSFFHLAAYNGLIPLIKITLKLINETHSYDLLRLTNNRHQTPAACAEKENRDDVVQLFKKNKSNDNTSSLQSLYTSQLPQESEAAKLATLVAYQYDNTSRAKPIEKEMAKFWIGSLIKALQLDFGLKDQVQHIFRTITPLTMCEVTWRGIPSYKNKISDLVHREFAEHRNLLIKATALPPKSLLITALKMPGMLSLAIELGYNKQELIDTLLKENLNMSDVDFRLISNNYSLILTNITTLTAFTQYSGTIEPAPTDLLKSVFEVVFLQEHFFDIQSKQKFLSTFIAKIQEPQRTEMISALLNRTHEHDSYLAEEAIKFELLDILKRLISEKRFPVNNLREKRTPGTPFPCYEGEKIKRKTFLQEAVERHSLSLVKLLLELGADMFIEQKNREGGDGYDAGHDWTPGSPGYTWIDVPIITAASKAATAADIFKFMITYSKEYKRVETLLSKQSWYTPQCPAYQILQTEQQKVSAQSLQAGYWSVRTQIAASTPITGVNYKSFSPT